MEGKGEESTLFTTGINPKYHDCSVFQCLKLFNCNFSIKGMLIYKTSYFGDSKTELELIEMILGFKTPVLCKNRLVQFNLVINFQTYCVVNHLLFFF